MQYAIQFDTVVSSGTIQIPEHIMSLVPRNVHVTLVPTDKDMGKFRAKTKIKPSGIDEFPAVLNTKGWKWNREEANERR